MRALGGESGLARWHSVDQMRGVAGDRSVLLFCGTAGLDEVRLSLPHGSGGVGGCPVVSAPQQAGESAQPGGIVQLLRTQFCRQIVIGGVSTAKATTVRFL